MAFIDLQIVKIGPVKYAHFPKSSHIIITSQHCNHQFVHANKPLNIHQCIKLKVQCIPQVKLLVVNWQ